MISKIIKKVQGFTLIETMVAVLLLATAIAGPLTIASKGLSAALVARDQMIAFYLAQDAIEYVRYARDSNKLSGQNWLTGTTNLSACTGANGCYIDPSTATIAACPGGGCSILYKHTNGASVYFTYNAGDTPTPQQFKRTITLTAPTTGETTEEVLAVSVSWRTQANVVRTITVRENLLDWQ